MSEENRARYFVRNHQNQPVELHLATGLVVLGPREEGEVHELDLATPQLKVLQRKRLVTTREVVETRPPAAPPGEPDDQGNATHHE